MREQIRDLGERRGVVASEVVDEYADGLQNVALLGGAVGFLLEGAAVLLEAREEGEQEVRIELCNQISVTYFPCI